MSAQKLAEVIDLDSRRATLILQVAHVRAEAEVHRQIGINSSLSFRDLKDVLVVSFDLPAEGAPWHFFTLSADAAGAAQPGAARPRAGSTGKRIDPTHLLRDFLRQPGQQLGFSWGLWTFTLSVADCYPRDAGTPQALCVGGSGSFGAGFDIADINAQLTGAETADTVLSHARAEVRDLVDRSQLSDFISLLQAVDLARPVTLPPHTRAALASLPRETTAQGRDAFWSAALALTCMGDTATTDAVLGSTMQALGWSADASLARARCASSLRVLEGLGAAVPPVDRLDIYRALLQR
ncbi:hypothetical protein G7Y31_00475 [Corynebacterium lizhenjunii]|uniref:Uncharacterized protein n=1 Tax=Corynebacterium lizhenjunii TaxID=2709394 RepID=A0A7T0KED1_9CORY|nr:hypothetical protein [Corynebacterium lizhenjunii]QPK79250.1 hypothetical protein G7Y31_00475 [Corynebacterium lizhenjunii]